MSHIAKHCCGQLSWPTEVTGLIQKFSMILSRNKARKNMDALALASFLHNSAGYENLANATAPT
jgi:hypothetical protein